MEIGTQTQGEQYVNMKEEIRVVGLQAKECQGFLANHHRKLGERHGTRSYRQGRINPTNTLISGF